MNTAKINILKETFEKRFDIEHFKKFTREFFNEPEMLKEIRHTGIWKEYADHIKAYYTVAKYTDNEDNNLIVMAVELKRNTSIDRARSMQRNFISKILDDNSMEAAIVAFYTEGEPSWRLSFVRLDYSFTEKGIDLDLTPARRYSYLVGENEPNHTAQEQLLPLFEDDKHNPILDEIENSFSVEKVTKDFFNQYKEKYLDIKEYLKQDESFISETKKLGFEVDKFAEQFAKKLMGQLAFLYFLQKKGWLGVRIMPASHAITIDSFKKIYNKQDSIHKSVLEKVFKNTKDENMKLSSRELFMIDEHEAELLSDCFITTEYDMPWGSGNRRFIREIFDFCKENTNKNFFDDYLEPFFYDALNKKRKNHYFKRFNCKIPFLNGGLFEPLEGYHWRDVNFKIPNELFSNKNEKGREADGILDIFDRFNFTMNEDEPLEKEVAVDPEMLGKIFENLLDVSDRKSKGAFYTPREIVHYMCQESLVNYLVNEVNVLYEDIKEFILYGELIRDADSRKNVGYSKQLTIKQSIFDNIVNIDDALKNVKVADPAVGSGAFPLGMLNEIVRARNNITEYIIKKDKEGIFEKVYGEDFIKKRRSPYKMKWDTIKNSIFAVDIEPSAVDITKLRLWLSVVVEQEIDDETREPHPLPNLDMNIHVGNSLIDEYEGIKLFDESILTKKINKRCEKSSGLCEQIRLFFDSDDLLKEMFDKQSQYFDEANEHNKKFLKEKIDELRDQLIEYKLRESGNNTALNKYNMIKNQKSKPYFVWELEFAKVFQEKGGFDIVIGNPPYIKEYTNSSIFEPLKNNLYYQGKMDFWYFFACKGLDLLCDKGVQCFIAPNNWITSSGASKLRNKIIQESKILKFIDFGNFKVFETASIQTMIYILKKEKQNIKYNISYAKMLLEKPSIKQLKNFLYMENIERENIKFKSKIEPGMIIDKYITFIKKDIEILLQKISKNSSRLKKENIAQGIVAPQDFLNKKNALLLGDEFTEGDGIFILSDKEVNDMNLTNNEKLFVKPYYTSNELSKYYITKKNKYNILYCKPDMNKVINNYPNIKRHLDKFTKIITSSNKPYGLHRARKEDFFNGEKILSLRKCKNPVFTFSDKECYVSQTYNIIKPVQFNIKYLLGLLNSKLIKFWLKYMGKRQGNNFQIDKEPLLNIPIVTDKEHEPIIIDLVNKINETKNDNDKKMIVDKIDLIIYKIYNLNTNEINLINKDLECN